MPSAAKIIESIIDRKIAGGMSAKEAIQSSVTPEAMTLMGDRLSKYGTSKVVTRDGEYYTHEVYLGGELLMARTITRSKLNRFLDAALPYAVGAAFGVILPTMPISLLTKSAVAAGLGIATYVAPEGSFIRKVGIGAGITAGSILLWQTATAAGHIAKGIPKPPLLGMVAGLQAAREGSIIGAARGLLYLANPTLAMTLDVLGL